MPRSIVSQSAKPVNTVTLEKIADEKHLKLVKVNIDENQDLAMRYGIQSIPNMILFEEGQPKANAVGAMPKGMLERSLGLATNGG